MSNSDRIHRVTEIVRTFARELVGSDGVTFVLRDGDFCVYLEEDAMNPLWKGRRFPMKECISGWVMMHARTVVIPDIFKDERIPIEAYSPTFVRSMAMAPIGRDRPVGAIGAYWSQAGYEPTQNQIDALCTLADSVALALETDSAGPG